MSQWIGVFQGRVSIAAFLVSGKGLIAGFRQPHSGNLIDDSGIFTLPPALLEQLEEEQAYWLAAAMDSRSTGTWVYQQKIQPSEEVRTHWQHRTVFFQRWQIHQAVRRFFLDSGFTEVDTPLIVPCPGMEPYLDSFAAGTGFLRTSPELHMKRLLAAGYQSVFQMGPCFRAGDQGSLHREEFHMLEWYRAFADLDHLIRDVSNLLASLSPLASEPEYFTQKPEISTCAALFQRYLGVVLSDGGDREPLRKALQERGIGFAAEDDWDTLFFLLFLNFIEPHLGCDAPLIVTDYPASQAALAKLAPSRSGSLNTCYRFEVYMRGMEIANAFYELTDPSQQRTRFREDQRKRAALKKVVYPIDEAFMYGLASGLPPTAGIALGLDRLAMVLLGKGRLDQILPFPQQE